LLVGIHHLTESINDLLHVKQVCHNHTKCEIHVLVSVSNDEQKTAKSEVLEQGEGEIKPTENVRLVNTLLVNFLVLNFVNCECLHFISESFKSPDVTEGLLGDTAEISLCRLELLI